MSDYNKYVLAINKIFEVLKNCKEKWNDNDNLSKIADLEEYKNIVIKAANAFPNSNKSENITEQESMKQINNLEGVK